MKVLRKKIGSSIRGRFHGGYKLQKRCCVFQQEDSEAKKEDWRRGSKISDGRREERKEKERRDTW